MSVEELPELLLADDAALDEPPAGAAALDELELDEQAASASAAPTESTPSAARAARGACLLVLKRFMRPRIICIQGRPDHCAQGRPDHSVHRLVPVRASCQQSRYRDQVSLRSLSPDQYSGDRNVVIPPHSQRPAPLHT